MATKRRDCIQRRQNDDGTLTYRAQIRLKGHPTASGSFQRLTDARRWVEETKTGAAQWPARFERSATHHLGTKRSSDTCARCTPKKKDRERETRDA